jgi:hypothetical protein
MYAKFNENCAVWAVPIARHKEPFKRFSSEPIDPSLLVERIRFPSATELTAKNRFMKSPMEEEVSNTAFNTHFSQVEFL